MWLYSKNGFRQFSLNGVASVGLAVISGLALMAAGGAALSGNNSLRSAEPSLPEHPSKSSVVSSSSITSSTIQTNAVGDAAPDEAKSSTKVTVNGLSVKVPANGSAQQTISTPDGQTTVNISHNQNTNGNSGGYTSTSLDVSATTNSSSMTDLQITQIGGE